MGSYTLNLPVSSHLLSVNDRQAAFIWRYQGESLLIFLFEELTKMWVRNRRRRFAIERVMEKRFPPK